MRCALGREGLDEPFLLVRANRNDDLVGGKGRERVTDGKTEVRLTGNGINWFAREPLGRLFGDSLRMAERLLVVGEPVECALAYDRHHDLDRVVLPEVRA